MKVVEIKDVEDCFDDSITFEVELDKAMNEELMYRLSEGGKLDYHPEFPKPYFKITQSRKWTIQGIVGNKTFRVVGSPSNEEDPAEQIRNLIERKGN